MAKRNLVPDTNIDSSRDALGRFHTRDFYKGKSFNYALSWANNTHYFNDEYITDFVSYQGALLACRRSHLSSSNNEPILIYGDPSNPDKITGVDSPLWDFVLAGSEGVSGKDGQVYVPSYDEETGILDWELMSDGPDAIKSMNIKGEPGKGINSILKTSSSGNIDVYTITYTNGETTSFTVTNGKSGEKGESGRGILNISKTNSDGNVDTYTIFYTDGSNSKFTVVNGLNGKDGKNATIAIDSVETGEPGSKAEVINVGSASEAAFKFIIPQGKEGPEGKRIMIYRDYTDDSIKWGYYGDPSSEWTVLCYMWDLSSGAPGKAAIHVGPEDPITYRENHKDDLEIQYTYKHAEDMIWVDTNETMDFDHLNAIYHGYKLANGPLNFNEFKEAFANLGNISGPTTSGFKFEFRNTFDDLGTATKDKQNIIWFVNSTRKGAHNLYDEYIVIYKDGAYSWEKWGAEIIDFKQEDYYTKDEIDSQITNLETQIKDLTTVIWEDL